MKDFQFVAVNVGNANFWKLKEILIETDLMSVVHLNKLAMLTGSCNFKLPKEDNRTRAFIRRIKIEGLDKRPFIRIDRTYSKSELDNAKLLLLSIKTVGLDNPAKDQNYQKINVCPNCGAGTVPIEPLRIPVNKMGNKKIDRTAHAGRLIFNTLLAENIRKAGLTGITFHQAILGKEKGKYVWGKITNTLPQLNPKSVVKREKFCSLCQKSGYFDAAPEVNELWYQEKDIGKSSLKDFNQTYEYFGTSYEYIGGGGQTKLGGKQLPIVTQKVRQFLLKEKVKFVNFEPIFIL